MNPSGRLMGLFLQAAGLFHRILICWREAPASMASSFLALAAYACSFASRTFTALAALPSSLMPFTSLMARINSSLFMPWTPLISYNTKRARGALACHLRHLSPSPEKCQLSFRYLHRHLWGGRLQMAGVGNASTGYRREWQGILQAKSIDVSDRLYF